MTLEVQRFLRCYTQPNEALADLASQHGIKSSGQLDRVVLNYDITAKPGGLADECRGLVLSIPGWYILSLSFHRFYNHHESHAAPIDWSTAQVQQKVDGSLVTFYHDGDRWIVQTRGTVDGSGQTPACRGTFDARVRTLVMSRTGQDLDEWLAGQPAHTCVVCEYVGPHNRVVTPYGTEDLYLLTVTDKLACQELGPDGFVEEWPFSTPREYSMVGTLSDVISRTANLAPLEEGYVVVDQQYHRIKIKNPRYLAVARAVNAGGALTDQHLARLALLGDTDEIKGYFPELAPLIERYEGLLEHLCYEATVLWNVYGKLESRKAFAMTVKDHLLSPWLFQRYGGKVRCGPREWVVDNLRPERLVEAMLFQMGQMGQDTRPSCCPSEPLGEDCS